MNPQAYRFTCTLPAGLHARPASMIAAAVSDFDARILIAKIIDGVPGEPADARSVLSLIGLDVRSGDICETHASGRDAARALAVLQECVNELLARGEEAPPACGESAAPTISLPRGLRELGVPHVTGLPASQGVAMGHSVYVSGLALPQTLADTPAKSVDLELQAAHDTLAWVTRDLRLRATRSRNSLESELLRAHAQIASDPALIDRIEFHIRSGKSAPVALVDACADLRDRLRRASSAYIRDRAIDIQDVCMQLLDRLSAPATTGDDRLPSTTLQLDRDTILFADVLTPNQLLRLDSRFVKGLVLGHVGITSHTIILARSMGIPAIINAVDCQSASDAGHFAAIDGSQGFAITAASDDVRRYFVRRALTQRRLAAKLAPVALSPAHTSDGVRIEVGVNAAIESEVIAAVHSGAEGVGLLRTELLFLDKQAQPTEDEQFKAYLAVVSAGKGRPVIIRTFDIGGDKPAAFLTLPKEDNPFLGVRGLRLYPRHLPMLRTQLRAIARVSAIGPVKVMAPMVSLASEARWFRDQVREVQSLLASEHVAFDQNMPVGVMLEVPAAAFAMDHIAREVDFISIGTNDLCQYSMAADRGNSGVANLNSPLQPSFLRLLDLAVRSAKAGGLWVGVCGEMPSDPLHLPLLVALGADEISVAPSQVLAIKAALRELNAAQCRTLFQSASNAATADDVREMLFAVRSRAAAPRPLLDPELIVVHSDAKNKSEAIRDAVDLLFIDGRTPNPDALDDAVWSREETYSTGLGFGFAVPHCRSEVVRVPSLAVLKLAAPVDWQSTDGLPVTMVLLLAMPTSESAGGGAQSHLQIFAKLARKLMHEEFRTTLLGATDRATIFASLQTELGIT